MMSIDELKGRLRVVGEAGEKHAGNISREMEYLQETMNKISQDFFDQEKGVEAVACIYEIIGKLSTADSKLYMLKSETEKLINSLNK